jgi:hypothetical protein
MTWRNGGEKSPHFIGVVKMRVSPRIGKLLFIPPVTNASRDYLP